MIDPFRFIEFRGAIIGLDHLCHATVRSQVMENKDTCWELRIYIGDGEHGISWDFPTENEAQEAYNELKAILVTTSLQTEAVK